MYILIISPFMTTSSQGMYYNTQDIGLGKVLAAKGHRIEIYNFINDGNGADRQISDGLTVHFLRSRSLGKHSIHSYNFITERADAVICFSDNQMGFPRLRRRCRKLGIPCYPYIGVLKSHSPNPIKRFLLDLLIPNCRLYRGMTTFAKTPQVMEEMERTGIADVTLASVGLDGELLHKDFEHADAALLREELGLPPSGRIVLYIARMTAEKRPLELLDLFAMIRENVPDAHLVAIGKGELEAAFEAHIGELGLTGSVTWERQVLNPDIWKYFCVSDVMVNLNTEEIFGMAILEAMYYGCPVAARRAPGPEFILEDGKDGILCGDNRELAKRIEALWEDEEAGRRMKENAAAKVRARFMWEHTADIIEEKLRGK